MCVIDNLLKTKLIFSKLMLKAFERKTNIEMIISDIYSMTFIRIL